MDTRAVVLESARRLFAERGYRQVTIRQIATESGLSPAMVMKVGGSKEQLYADATPHEIAPVGDDWPTNDVGREIVRRILLRRDTDSAEPWLQSVLAMVDAPNPGEARDKFRAGSITWLAKRTPGGDLVRAQLAAAMFIGLASAVRAFRLLDDPDDAAIVIERYGSMVQSLFDDEPEDASDNPG